MEAVASDLQPAQAVPVHASGLVPEIQTVAVDVKLGSRLDLNVLARNAPNVEYKGKDPGGTKKYFDCATLRITKPAATGRVYTKGSMTVTGTKSPQDARLAVQKLCSVIQSAGFEVDQATVDATYKINNMLASCKAGFPVNLHGIHAQHSAVVKYEPSTWSGLHYYMLKPKVTLTIFRSGSFNMKGKGLQGFEDITRVLDHIWPILQAFKLKQPSAAPARAPAPAAAAAATASAATSAAVAAPAVVPAAQMSSSNTALWQQQQQQQPPPPPQQQQPPPPPQQQQQQQQPPLQQQQPQLPPPIAAGAQVQLLGRQVTTGIKRPRPAAEVIKAAAAAGKLPPAYAQRAAAGNRGFRVGEGPGHGLPPLQLDLSPATALPVELHQHNQQLGQHDQLYQQQYQQFLLLEGAPWPTAAIQSDALRGLQQSPAVETGAAFQPPALGGQQQQPSQAPAAGAAYGWNSSAVGVQQQQQQQQQQPEAPGAAAAAAFQPQAHGWQQQQQPAFAAAGVSQLPGPPMQQGLHGSWQEQQGQHPASAAAGCSLQEAQEVQDESMLAPASMWPGMPPATPVHEMMPEVASPMHHSLFN